ncbi:engulfment and cell motility protein 3 isoform X4 [Pteropus vampyrus]|uniref:Engulfment and cell motility protein 3 isoform X4 n=1 Tax=Pteropus vampyrus TaxID=132908 RepID=A0A6P6BVY3_PTEVA|nr:engulfment and cell motility protein 3 isoform X4 [Pteropus vampyrus]
MAPPRDVVKIAVQMRDAIPQLIQLDQAKPLAAVVKEVCDAWSLAHSERYALQFADGHRRYITENNRTEIKNGSILCLSTAPVVCYVNMNLMDASVQPLALGLLESVTLSSPALGQLVKSEVPLDRLLVHLQVMNQQLQTKAMALLTALLQGASPTERKHMLDYLWQRNLRQFIYKNIIHSAAPLGDEMAHHLYVLQSLTLGLLEPRMRTPLDPYSQEQREQLQALRQAAFEPEGESLGAGLNADRRRSLCAREFRKLGFSVSDRYPAPHPASSQGCCCSRGLRPFLSSPFPLPQNSNPAQDLEHVPPGLLALDNMLYFSRHAPSAYSRFVLENSSREDKHECPFARSSIQLTVLLCELLRVGEPCSETAQDFSPMFFGQDQSFHELFCVSIQLLNKTWKEMRATQEDFDKVMQVVREQLARTLALKPSSLELFRTKVNALTYGEVLRLRQTERLHQEGTLAPPILELREKLKPELMSLIRQQRLLRLCEGTLFRKISSRRRQDKLWFCCLSPNHKVLQYGDVEDNASPPAPESLPEQLPVADIRALLTGKDCPHIRDKGSVKQNKDLYELAFTISYDHGEEEAYLNFIAPSKREFHLWTDGLSTLLGSPMGSEQTRLDLEQLLTMETKLRLLELENVPIPEQPPPIPPPPTNFNFCYDCSIAEP